MAAAVVAVGLLSLLVVILVVPGHVSHSPRAVHPHPPVATRASNFLHCAYTSASISELSEFSRLVNRRIQCAELFNTPMPTWSEWEHPMFLDSVVAPEGDWVHWILAAPGRQLILAESLIPQEAESRGVAAPRQRGSLHEIRG